MLEHSHEVDIVFVGGESFSCVAAGRLAAANPDLDILIIEQGPNNFQETKVVTPGLFGSHLIPNGRTVEFWKATKSEALNSREIPLVTGGMLGGGSSVNFLMYCRPVASDFDDWNMTGWGSKDLVPLLKKFEKYHVTPGRATHGYEGPINVSCPNYHATVAQEYLDICVQTGIPMVEDLMDLHTGYGCSRIAQYVDPLTGYRQDTAHQYIHSQSGNKVLQLMTETLVTQVLFDGTKAIGVEVIGNKRQDPNADQVPKIILARRLVVVSAGTIGSALVLQRSGIGASTQLSKCGIDTVVDLPGIGANYEDHCSCTMVYHVADDVETLDPVFAGDPSAIERGLSQFKDGKGILTSNGIDAGSRLRPRPEELEKMGSHFKEVWKRYYEPAPEKSVILQLATSGFFGSGPLLHSNLISSGSRFMTTINFELYPLSRGHVYVTSNDPYSPPDFHTGFLEAQADVDVHVWGYKKSRELARRMPSYRGELSLMHPKFPEASAAACVRLEGPLPSSTRDIVYTQDDDQAIEEYVRQHVGVGVHPLGTARMAPREAGGCVDARLNVYGTEHLKVSDLSIIPGNVGGNTYSTALLVGEKAAILIAEDLGLILP
ncbi:hypothetical protein ACGC1H_006407 [Rhizoctonia solani]